MKLVFPTAAGFLVLQACTTPSADKFPMVGDGLLLMYSTPAGKSPNIQRMMELMSDAADYCEDMGKSIEMSTDSADRNGEKRDEAYFRCVDPTSVQK